MQPRTFLRQVASVGAISLVDRAVAVATGIVFARWLGASEFGIYSYVIALVGLLMLPARLGLPELVTRDLAASRSNGSINDFSGQLWKSAFLIFAAALTIVAAAQAILQWLPENKLTTALQLGLWLIIPVALLDLALGALRGLGRTSTFQLYGTLLLSLLTLGIGLAGMLIMQRFDAVISIQLRMAAVGLVLLIACLHLLSLLREMIVGGGKSEVRSGQLIGQGFTFMINAFVYMALMRVDLLVLGAFSSDETIGLYRVAVEGGLLVAFAYGAATVVLAPEYARLNATNDRAALQELVCQSSRMIMLAGAITAFPLIIFSESIIVFVFGNEFSGASAALSILAAGHLVTFLFGDPVFLLNMTGHHNRVTLLAMIGLLVSMVLSFALVPLLGPSGAAIAASVALIIYRFLAYRAVRQALGVNCAIWSRTLPASSGASIDNVTDR